MARLERSSGDNTPSGASYRSAVSGPKWKSIRHPVQIRCRGLLPAPHCVTHRTARDGCFMSTPAGRNAQLAVIRERGYPRSAPHSLPPYAYRCPLPRRGSQPPLFSYVCAFNRQVSKRWRPAGTQIRHAFQFANPDAARERYPANAVEYLRLYTFHSAEDRGPHLPT
jgi:hypothetical protein